MILKRDIPKTLADEAGAARDQLSGIRLIALLLREQGDLEELVNAPSGGAQAWHAAAPAEAAPNALPNM